MDLYVSQLKELALILENDARLHKEYPRHAAGGVGGRREAIRDAAMRNRCGQLEYEDREHLRRYLDKLWGAEPADNDAPGRNSYHALPFLDLGVEDPPVKPKQIDYTELPDGTILISREQGEWVKGVKTKDGGGKPRSGQPLWGCSADPTRSWMCWRADGKPERAQDSDYDIVGYRLAGTNPTPTTPIGDAEKEIAPMNKTAIIEITTLTLVNGNDVAKLPDSEVYELIAAQEAEIARLEAINAQPKKLKVELEKRRAGIKALVAHLDSKE